MPEDNENNEQETSKKSSKLKFIIIGVVALVLIIVILVVVYSLVLAPKANEADNTQAQAQNVTQAAPAPAVQAPAAQQQMNTMPPMDMGMGATEIGQIYPIPTMNVNLADPTGITYLAITLALEFDPKNSELYKEIEAKMPRILDMIITVLSSKAYEEISTSQGKVNLRNEFLRRINSMMAKGKLYNVYITGFTVQR